VVGQDGGSVSPVVMIGDCGLTKFRKLEGGKEGGECFSTATHNFSSCSLNKVSIESRRLVEAAS